MIHFISVCYTTFTVIVVGACAVRAEPLDGFQPEYAAAEAKLEKAYACSQAVGTHELTDSGGKLVWKKSFQMDRRDRLMRELTTALESNDPRFPPGSISVGGGSKDKYFEMYRELGQQSYVITRFGPSNDFDEEGAGNLVPLYASYFLMNVPVPDLLRDSKKVVKFVHEEVYDARPTVRVDFATNPPQRPGYVFEGTLYFLRPSWALAGWHFCVRKPAQAAENVERNLTMEGMIHYASLAPVPEVSKVETWRVRIVGKSNENIFDVTKMKFSALPADQFEMKALGVVEPSSPIP